MFEQHILLRVNTSYNPKVLNYTLQSLLPLKLVLLL